MYCDKYPESDRRKFYRKHLKIAPWPRGFKYRTGLTGQLAVLMCDCRNDQLKNFLKYSPSAIKLEPRSHDGVYVELCARCESLSLNNLKICINCTDRFIKDFSHPGYCNLSPYCLSCFIDEGVDDPCTKHVIGTRPTRLYSLYDNFPLPKPQTAKEVLAGLDSLLEGL